MRMPVWLKQRERQPAHGRNPKRAASPAAGNSTEGQAMDSTHGKPQQQASRSQTSQDVDGLPRPGDAMFSPDRMRALQQDTLGPKEKARLLRDRDRAGLSFGQWALAEAVSQGADATMMLRELSEPTPAESAKLDRMLNLVESMAQAVIRIEHRLILLESDIAGNA